MRGQIIKNLLAASLEEQLKKKHIDSITVNDIIADVGTTTRHCQVRADGNRYHDVKQSKPVP